MGNRSALGGIFVSVEMVNESLSAERETPKVLRLESLYQSHVTGAMRLAFLLTGDADLAQDIAQDAFVSIAGRFAHLRDESLFVAYLRKTVINRVRAHGRARGREQRRLEREAVQGVRVTMGPDIETRHQLAAALLRLPVRQRTAIVLRFYVDLSESETADILNCRPGTVKSLTSRGLATLRELVGR